MRILVLTSFVPYPLDSGAKIRVANQLKYISQENEVVLLCPIRANSNQIEAAQQLKSEFHIKVNAIPWHKRSKIKYLRHLFRYIKGGEPIGDLTFYYEELAEAIYDITATQHFDIIHVHNAYMAPYIDCIAPNSKSKTVLDLHNVPYTQWQRMMLNERNLYRKIQLFRDWIFKKHATGKYIRRYDKTLVVSEMDKDILLKDFPKINLENIPIGFNTDEFRPLNQPSTFRTLMFIGSMFYGPNRDAAIYLCHQIFPLVKQQIQDAQLLIVGSSPSEDVLRLQDRTSGVVVTGYVDSVIPYYEQSCLTLVPLRAGSGTRVKILESMALGRPVVSTKLGCEGLQVTNGDNILIADKTADFSADVVRLMTDLEEWKRISINAHLHVKQHYDWRIIGKKLTQAYNNEFPKTDKIKSTDDFKNEDETKCTS
jgi:glycosyltransferase involved in cell wall biosynthesis